MESQSVEYSSFSHMHRRCTDPRDASYKTHGGRGICVCERWEVYRNFLEDMGRKPSRLHSLERVDNNGNYEPSNCVWALRSQQANNKRNNRRATFNGENLTAAQWARKVGIRPETMSERLRRGWPIERALTVPIIKV